MRLTNLLFISCFFITMFTFAQKSLHLGVKAGVNLTGFHTSSSINSGNSGINFGGLAELQLNDLFSLQSEIIYNRKGELFDVRDGSFSEFYTIKTDLDYIDIPIQAKIHVLKKVSLDLGAQVGFLWNSTGEITNSQNNNGEEVEFTSANTLDAGVNGGFTIKFHEKFSICQISAPVN